MNDYFIDRMKEYVHMNGKCHEMKGFVRSALSRVHVVGENDYVPRWVLVEVQKMIDEALEQSNDPRIS